MNFPFTHQLGVKDCGPACLKMIAGYYGRHYAIDFLRDKCHITKVGVSLFGISEAAEAIGFHSMGVRMSIEQLKEIVQDAPIILHWNESHFVVVYKSPRPGKKGKFLLADPAKGLLKYNEEEFASYWIGKEVEVPSAFEKSGTADLHLREGYALLLEPTPSFFDEAQKEGLQKNVGFSRLWHYFTPHRKYFFQLTLGLLISSIVLLITPFFTQALVDNGINQHDLNFIYLILFGQLVLFAGTVMVDIIRSYLLLHIGSRINISMVSDFFQKMLKLPISFFETHITGDLMQRISDHKRIENLLTVSSLNTLFSLINLIVLSIVLAIYSSLIFFVFLAGSLLGFLWMWIFLKRRRNIDFKFFEWYSKDNSKVMEIINGVQDIKISNSAQQKRWEWENIQASLFKTKIRSLTVGQLQNIGASVFKQCTSIFITFIAAKSVIDGEISLGTMFAINMIIGQLSSPLEHLLELVTTLQDAKIGLERINDVIIQQDEDPAEQQTISEIPDKEDILMNGVTFNYGSERLDPVLKDISLEIPSGKVTAIVGASGSGKTTLMKLLLRFYEPQKGSIFLGGTNFKSMHHGMWRRKCGVVMQDGQIFNGTIADNISLGEEKNYGAIIKAARIANIDEFINSLALGFMTEIGAEGSPLSAGQTQRILLARAVYKNPSYLFLDEATSALDANNEKTVIENLNEFFEGRTVVVIAHRLSTVKNADQLIVLDKGCIVEIGSHLDLTYKKGIYYTLVKNQLELGE
ncbi:MAG: peptidase domain-containing ABC transporter [Chitinophagales bacterium]